MFGLAMSNAETFQSLVAMSQAIREHMLGHGVTAGTSSQVLHHKGMALHALQQRIKSRSSVDETMMLTVLNLLALDVCIPKLVLVTCRAQTNWCWDSSFVLRAVPSVTICLPCVKWQHSQMLSTQSCRSKSF